VNIFAADLPGTAGFDFRFPRFPTRTFNMIRNRPIFLVLSVLLAACGAGQHPDVQVAGEAAMPVVRALVASIGAGSIGYFDSKVDSAAFIERATSGLDISGLERAVARIGIFSKISLGDVVRGDVEKGGSYRFLHLHTVAGETRALVRIVTPSGELNYHDIVLGYRPGTGEVAVRDVFVYKIGEPLSRTFSMLFADAIESDEHAASSRASGLVEALDTIARMAKEGQFDEARRYYMAQPPEQRKAKIGLSLYLTMCGVESAEAYHGAIDEYLRYYPRDTGAAMLRVDRAMIDEKYDSALAAIDRLDTIVGGDPYLDHLRGYAIAARGDTTAGVALMRKSIAADPTLAAVYWSYIDILVAQHNYPEAVRLIGDVAGKAMLTRDEIDTELRSRSLPAYARFFDSREYVAWEKK
jgi:hypothetical protein